MTLRRKRSEAHVAETRVTSARARLRASMHAINSHTRTHPLTCTGIAAGAGWTLGRLNMPPCRITGMTRLLAAQVLPRAIRLMAMLRDPA